MLRIAVKATWIVAAIAGCYLASPAEECFAQTTYTYVEPGYLPRLYGQPDLFAQYYHPAEPGQIPAEMYPAPHPTPPWVGHTYYTYQPLYPHELLHTHSRTYHRYYNFGRGLNRTKVTWW
jgi:hypothetical protein